MISFGVCLERGAVGKDKVLNLLVAVAAFDRTELVIFMRMDMEVSETVECHLSRKF